MSEENVNSLRWILQQVFGGRRIRPELLAEDAEWVNPHDAIEPGTRRGADSFNAAIRVHHLGRRAFRHRTRD
jgi:hypothetical protein